MTDLCGGIALPGNPADDLCGEDPWCLYDPDHDAGGKEHISLDGTDFELLDALQDDFPLMSRPFGVLSGRLGIPENDVIKRLNRLKEIGVVRGLSPVLESGRVGLSAATLIALRVPDERIAGVAQLISNYPEVSHNFHRDNDYSIWFTIAAKDEERINEILQEIKQQTDFGEEDILELPTVRRFKVDVRFSFTGNNTGRSDNG